MARIVYSTAGEGRGHATRVRTLVEHLRREHEVQLFAPGDAYDFLAPLYAGSDVRVHRIPGLFFHYDKRQRVDLGRTAWHGARYLRRLPRLIDTLADRLERSAPDLALCDFEPALPRAARRLGVPSVAIAHQHVLAASRFDELPPLLRLSARAQGLAVRAWDAAPVRTLISSFYRSTLRPNWRDARQVGVLLRPEVRARKPSQGTHLLAYLRRAMRPAVLDALVELDREVRVYGLGEQPARGRVSFHAVSEAAFLDDLASCAALVCTAGNQIVGEAAYFGKPVFAVPEEGNREQAINAHFVAIEQLGEWELAPRLSARRLHEFLERASLWRRPGAHPRHDGTPAVLDELGALLGAEPRPRLALV